MQTGYANGMDLQYINLCTNGHLSLSQSSLQAERARTWYKLFAPVLKILTFQHYQILWDDSVYFTQPVTSSKEMYILSILVCLSVVSLFASCTSVFVHEAVIQNVDRAIFCPLYVACYISNDMQLKLNQDFSIHRCQALNNEYQSELYTKREVRNPQSCLLQSTELACMFQCQLVHDIRNLKQY